MSAVQKAPAAPPPSPRTPPGPPRHATQVPDCKVFSALLALAAGPRPAPRGAPGRTEPRGAPDAHPKGQEAAEAPEPRRTPARTPREPADDEPRRARPDDPLDPTTRALAHLGQPLAPAPALPAAGSAPTSAAPTPPSLEHLVPQVVRKIAWGGDKRKAAVRMELGGGLSGAVVVVHSDEGRLRVEVDGPAGEVDRFRERIEARLRKKGLDVTEVR